jgi:hypothetical protein
LRGMTATANLRPSHPRGSSGRRSMVYWIGVLLAFIGASLILGALTFVSALIGAVVNAMIVLMCGPLIDRLAQRRGRAVKG